jgi:hypothetical protein
MISEDLLAPDQAVELWRHFFAERLLTFGDKEGQISEMLARAAQRGSCL